MKDDNEAIVYLRLLLRVTSKSCIYKISPHEKPWKDSLSSLIEKAITAIQYEG